MEHSEETIHYERMKGDYLRIKKDIETMHECIKYLEKLGKGKGNHDKPVRNQQDR